jgi:hypothetical protein
LLSTKHPSHYLADFAATLGAELTCTDGQKVSTSSTWQSPHHDASDTRVAVGDAKWNIEANIGRFFNP